MLVLLVLALAVVMYALLRTQSKAMPVRLVTVDSGPIISYIRASGAVEGTKDIDVASRISGQCQVVNVKVGDHVAQGSVLARLDDSGALAQVRADAAALGEAKAELERQARTVASLETDYRIGAESAHSVEDAKSQLEILQARLEKARANVALSRSKLGEFALPAPERGTVASVNIRPGEYATAGATLFTLTVGGAEDIKVKVDQADAAAIRPGMKALVSLENSQDSLSEETVLRVAPTIQVEGTSTFLPVWTSMVGVSLHGLPNQQVDVKIVTAAKDRVARLPLEAIVSAGTADHVWVVKDGRLHLADVHVGVTGDRYSEIVSGLTVGQQVVAPDGRQFVEGEIVAVEPSAAP